MTATQTPWTIAIVQPDADQTSGLPAASAQSVVPTAPMSNTTP